MLSCPLFSLLLSCPSYFLALPCPLLCLCTSSFLIFPDVSSHMPCPSYFRVRTQCSSVLCSLYEIYWLWHNYGKVPRLMIEKMNKKNGNEEMGRERIDIEACVRNTYIKKVLIKLHLRRICDVLKCRIFTAVTNFLMQPAFQQIGLSGTPALFKFLINMFITDVC